MRDIIWTIIAVWVIWRIIDAFKVFSQKTSGVNSNNSRTYSNQGNDHVTNSYQEPVKKGHLKPDAGEYIDYEETK